MHIPGDQRFVALIGEIVKVTIVAQGVGRHTFERGKTPKNPFVVRAERTTRCGLTAGDEFCVPAALLYSSPIEANIESMKLAQEFGDSEDDFDEDEDEEGEED